VQLGGRPGDLATSIGAPAELLPSATQFVADYRAAGFAEPYEAYGVLTFDAANVIIQAMASGLASGEYSEERRADVVTAVQGTDIEGASGPVSFDQYGDTTNKVLTVYAVEGGSWVPVQGSTGSFEG
jgi:branched-chain amino acid transport system substrate-binding protein